VSKRIADIQERRKAQLEQLIAARQEMTKYWHQIEK